MLRLIGFHKEPSFITIDRRFNKQYIRDRSWCEFHLCDLEYWQLCVGYEEVDLAIESVTSKVYTIIPIMQEQLVVLWSGLKPVLPLLYGLQA